MKPLGQLSKLPPSACVNGTVGRERRVRPLERNDSGTREQSEIAIFIQCRQGAMLVEQTPQKSDVCSLAPHKECSHLVCLSAR